MKYKFGMFKPHTYKKLKIILGFAPLPKYYKKNELIQKDFLRMSNDFRRKRFILI